jgi:signal transduction histidine kinase
MQSSSQSVTSSKSPADKRTLLIVDDEDGPRQSLRVLFAKDYNILMANGGAKAIELAKQNRIDVAITDIRMEGMSGVELLEHLKVIDPAIEVIMLTAYETADTLRFALRLGACDYLNKPFEISAIRKSVLSAMERRSMTEEIKNNNLQLQELQKELLNQKTTIEITRSRGEIYGSIIHDINGPLTVISGFMQLMNQRIGAKQKVEGEDLDFMKDRLKITIRQVTNCIEISRRYLSFLRQNASESPHVGVNQLLADLHQLIRVDSNVKQNEFTVKPLEKDCAVKINGTDLIQLIRNLVINGFQCSQEKHSVEVRGVLLEGPLDLAQFVDGPESRFLNGNVLDNSGRLAAISVEDTGPGIPPELLGKIFERGFSTKAPTEGTGLGLDVVVQLIARAKGALHLKTKVGKGTLFTVYLPATV